MSPMLPYLQSNDTNINPLKAPITVWQTSILAGSPILASVLGALLLPKLSDHIGRKNFLIITTTGMFVFYLILAFFHRFSFLLICRMLFGILGAGFMVTNQVYVAEICEDHNRAKYLCLSSLFLSLGNVYAFAIGSYFNYVNFNIIVSIPAVVFLLFWFAPETPVYSISKGKIDDCKNALIKLRNNKNLEEIDADLNKLDYILKSMKTEANFVTLFKTKETRRAFTISLLLFVTQYISGIAAITTFLGPLLHKSGTALSVDTLTIGSGLLQMMTSILTSSFIENFDRKVLLIFSCASCSLTLFLFGLFCLLKSYSLPFIYYIQWSPTICIVLYFITFGVGLGSATNTVVTEIFPPDLITTGMSLATSLINIVISATIFIFPIIEAYAGLHVCLWVFSFSCLLGGVLIYKIVPETRGKSRLEIQKMLQRT